MSDPQDRAEALDDDHLGGDFPPDKLLGAQAYGAAGAEPHAGESVAARAAREEPEEVPDPTGAPVPEEEVRSEEAVDPDAVVQEMEAPLAAEEAAMHLEPEGLGQVSDPDGLAEAGDEAVGELRSE